MKREYMTPLTEVIKTVSKDMMMYQSNNLADTKTDSIDLDIDIELEESDDLWDYDLWGDK